MSSSRQNIVRLLDELELSPNTSFEREVVSDGDMVSLTLENMDALKQYNDEVCFPLLILEILVTKMTC